MSDYKAEVTCSVSLRHRALKVSQASAATVLSLQDEWRLCLLCALRSSIDSPSEHKGLNHQFSSLQPVRNSIPLWEIKWHESVFKACREPTTVPLIPSVVGEVIAETTAKGRKGETGEGQGEEEGWANREQRMLEKT